MTGLGPYEVEVVRDVMVPMRDGVRLAADLYLPKAEDGKDVGPVPTVLSRIPYGKEGEIPPGKISVRDWLAAQGTVPDDEWRAQRKNVSMPQYMRYVVGEYFASHGYVVVLQDVRGRHASEGTWRMLTPDGPDGVDTCAWIGQQPWSDGQVGMFGTSYQGGTQHAAALEGAAELKTVIPVDAMSNMGQRGIRYDGAFEPRMWNWVVTGGNGGHWDRTNPAAIPALEEMVRERYTYLRNFPFRRGTTPLKHAPEYEDWVVEALGHGVNDEFWAQNDILGGPETYKDIPVYLVGGWYDSWAGNTTANFEALQKQIAGPVYLIMGSWIHGGEAASSHGQVSFGPDAAIPDGLSWRREWFDRWLKGIDNTVGKAAPFATPVRIFVMGTGSGTKTADGLLDHGGFWRDEEEWPLSRARPTEWYLHGDGSLSTTPPAIEGSSTTFDFDPNDPVPTVGGNVSSAEGILLQGAWDQRGGDHIWNSPEPVPLSIRRDVLVFQSAPLEADLEVTGDIVVKLWASSSAVDTDFTAKLIDVYPASEDWPGGFDLLLEDGIVRGRFRESLAAEKMLEPGETYEFTIRLYPTSNVFKQGHRIRVDVSSSNFPRFDVNPNTGEPLNQHRRMVIATNTVFHEHGRPSRIVLPVVASSGS